MGCAISSTHKAPLAVHGIAAQAFGGENAFLAIPEDSNESWMVPVASKIAFVV
jgi:hypothetical protein